MLVSHRLKQKTLRTKQEFKNQRETSLLLSWLWCEGDRSSAKQKARAAYKLEAAWWGLYT